MARVCERWHVTNVVRNLSDASAISGGGCSSNRAKWMTSQCLFTGLITCLDGDTNEVTAEIDYRPISSSVVSPLWSSASTCDPLKDLKRLDCQSRHIQGCSAECSRWDRWPEVAGIPAREGHLHRGAITVPA